MVLSHGVVLRVVRPLYGMPESGLQWYLTYLEHHTENLWMRRATTYPFVLLKTNRESFLSGLVMLQVLDL